MSEILVAIKTVLELGYIVICFLDVYHICKIYVGPI